VAVSLPFHGELNILVDTVQVVKEVPQPVWSVRPYNESVVHVTEPAEGLISSQLCAISLKSSMKKLAMTKNMVNP
jgi:hypothetical protein